MKILHRIREQGSTADKNELGDHHIHTQNQVDHIVDMMLFAGEVHTLSDPRYFKQAIQPGGEVLGLIK